MVKLNPDIILNVSGAFLELFTKLCRDKDGENFIEVFCGLIYTTRKIVRVLEITGALSKDKLEEIEKSLNDAVLLEVPGTTAKWCEECKK